MSEDINKTDELDPIFWEYPFARRYMTIEEFELERSYMCTVPIDEYKNGNYTPLWKHVRRDIKREDLSEDKKKQYDAIIGKIVQEIDAKHPEQYRYPGHFDERAKHIYENIYEKYIPDLRLVFGV